MSDLRARLADVLGDAFINVPAGVNDDFSWANYLADVLLSLPGIAIVELPEPDPDIGSYFDAGCGAIAHVTEGDVRLHSAAWRQGAVYRSPAMAHVLAAALLAAANAAEQAAD